MPVLIYKNYASSFKYISNGVNRAGLRCEFALSCFRSFDGRQTYTGCISKIFLEAFREINIKGKEICHEEMDELPDTLICNIGSLRMLALETRQAFYK